MTDPAQVAFTMGVPTLAVLIGILTNNNRQNDLRGYMDTRFTSVDRRMDERFAAADRRMDDMRDTLRAELHRVEEVVDARLTRIEHELRIR